jgi:hypothetical protein
MQWEEAKCGSCAWRTTHLTPYGNETSEMPLENNSILPNTKHLDLSKTQKFFNLE